MFRLFSCSCLLMHFFLFTSAQNHTEVNDSLNLFQKDFSINAAYFDAAFFETYFPQSGTFNAMLQMESQFLHQPDQASNWQTIYMPRSDFHYYHSPSFTFWRNSKPLLFSATYHTNNLFGFEQLNFFADVNGQVINNYELNELNYLVPSEESLGLFWQIGTGIGYEFAPRKTVFIKSSAHFRNTQFIGTKHVGGINVRF
ncbi:MAG: hypothetical protein JW735_12155 [Prolixibacteraceae bacterium]|nr:hypothetical protein [Prolixibacteraceae bacterium]